MAQALPAGFIPTAPAAPPSTSVDRSQWDRRPDGSAKGDGFLGVLQIPGTDGVATEYSIADSEKLKDAKGNYIDYPSLVPTLTAAEVREVLKAAGTHGPLSDTIKQKAEAFALQRRAAGKPLFAQPGEQNATLYPELTRAGAAKPSADVPAGFEPTTSAGGPEMTFAIVNGVKVPLGGDTADFDEIPEREQPPGNVSRFGTRLLENAKGIKDTLPIPQFLGGAGVVQGPVNALGGLVASHFDQALKAYDTFKAGDYTSAAIHGAAALVPGVGPMVANAAEELTAGKTPEAIADAITIGGVPHLIEAAKGIPGAARNVAANRAAARVTRQSANAVLPDLIKAVPPSKTASWNPGDWLRAGKYIIDEHSSAPINSVETLRDSAEAAVTKIEDHVAQGVAANPNDLIRTDPIQMVKDAFKGRARSDDLAIGLKEIESLGLDKPTTLVDAENARKRLNAENTATLRKNHIDRYTARTQDPAFAAREVAAEALRDGIYDQLEARGMTGVRELRRDEGSILRIRNAAERQIYAGDRAVPGTGKDGPVRRIAAKASTVIGGAAGAASAGPVGAAVGAGVGHEVGGMFSTPNLTRNALIEKAFKNVVGTGVTMPPLPVAPPISGLLTAGAPQIGAGNRSFVRGIPAQYAQRVDRFLPAAPQSIELPAAPDPSYVKGVPAEYAKRETQIAAGPVEASADAQRADLPREGVQRPAVGTHGAEARRLETERIETARQQQRKEILDATALEDTSHELEPREDTIDAIVATAQKEGYAGDPAELRSEIDLRLQAIKEMDAELAAAGRNPENLLKEIARLGGLSIKNETGLKGELKWLQQLQDTPSRGIPRGTVRGIRGVFKDSGLSVDDMLRGLKQEGKFSHINNLNDLLDEIRATNAHLGGSAFRRITGRDDMIKRLRDSLGPGWWENVGAGVEDFSFKDEEP